MDFWGFGSSTSQVRMIEQPVPRKPNHQLVQGPMNTWNIKGANLQGKGDMTFA